MKCFNCVYYNLKNASNYNYCLKFNTFCEVARDPKKCGPVFKEFKKREFYNKLSVNF